MPCYIYGRPVRPADDIKGVASKELDKSSKATPDFCPSEKILDTEDNMPKGVIPGE